MHRLIFRVLNEVGGLLGWTEHMARAKGDGQLWTTGLVTVVIETPGSAHAVSTHWPDVNVETRVPMPLSTVKAGDVILIYGADTVALVVGPMPDSLPPVTVRGPVQVPVPVGSLTALAQA